MTRHHPPGTILGSQFFPVYRVSIATTYKFTWSMRVPDAMHQSTQQQYGAALPDSGKYENQLTLSWSNVTCITSIETCRTLAGWNCSWNFQPSGLLCPVINDVLSELEGQKKKNVHGQKYEKLIADAKNRNGHHTRRPAPRANGPFAKPENVLTSKCSCVN